MDWYIALFVHGNSPGGTNICWATVTSSVLRRGEINDLALCSNQEGERKLNHVWLSTSSLCTSGDNQIIMWLE